VGIDTKNYDVESNEEVSQKYSEKVTELEQSRTFTWNEIRLWACNETFQWAALTGISATLIKRSDNTCYVNFSINITSFGYHTENNPSSKENPPLIPRCKNKSGGVLFRLDIETEPYKGGINHGLTVRCEYNNEPKDSRYEVGVVPYNEGERVTLIKPGGNPVYLCKH